MKKNLVIFIILSLLLSSICFSVPYYSTPSWQTDSDLYSFTMSVALADLDNDGDLDLIVGNYSYHYEEYYIDMIEEIGWSLIGQFIWIYEWDNTNSCFLNPIQIPYQSPKCIDCIEVADYNDDGDLDIAVGVVVGRGNDGGVFVYNNSLSYPDQEMGELFSGNDVWHPEDSYDCHCVRWVDYDSDGDLDLAALEIPGIVHFYGNNDNDLVGQTFQLDVAMPPPPLRASLATETDDLIDNPYDYPISGSTMEFGDMDGNGFLDLFINIYGTGDYSVSSNIVVLGNSGTDPYFGDHNFTWSAAPTAGHYPNDDHFCGSFGHMVVDPAIGPELVLATGSMDISGNRGDYFNSPWGDDIYRLDQTQWRLVHIGKSYNPETTTDLPQLVTDIKWARFDNENSPMDIVAVSYPAFATDASNLPILVRGLEVFHTDPELELNVNDHDFSSDFINDQPDYSTSLALGDIDYGTSAATTISNAEVSDAFKWFTYVKNYPFIKVNSVIAEDIDNNQILGSNDIKFCYSTNDGWISARPIGTPPANFHHIRIEYKYSNELDLAVGNDGRDAVYFYGATTGTTYEVPNPEIMDMIPDPLYTYNRPPEIAQDEVDLMDDNCLGFTGEVFNPLDFDEYLTDHEEIKRVGIQHAWYRVEIFKGHFFWDYYDKNLDLIRQHGAESHIVQWHDPLWSRGNYDPNASDTRKRASDMKLNMWMVHALVNRYRPYGLLSQAYAINSETGYDWGDWGVSLYQFDNEPNYPHTGYGANPDQPDAVMDMAKKTFLQYQMIKKIADNVADNIQTEYDLYLISPNFGPVYFDEFQYPHDDFYIAPPLPYLNDLDDATFTYGSSQITGTLNNYCDYIATQIYGAKNEIDEERVRFVDNFTPDSVIISIQPDVKYPMGFEHKLWGFYTDGLDQYYLDKGVITSTTGWDPIIDANHEKPFFIFDVIMATAQSAGSGAMSFNELPWRDWNAARIAEMFSTDIYPQSTTLNKYMVECFPNRWVEYQDIFRTCASIMDKQDIHFEGCHPYYTADGDSVQRFTYAYSINEPNDGYIHFIKTHQRNTPAFDPSMTNPNPYTFDLGLDYTADDRVDCYLPEGGYFQLTVDDAVNNRITFNEGEITPGMLIIHEHDNPPAGDNQTQTVYLHDGWNMTAWHLQPEDPDPGSDLLISEVLPEEEGYEWFHENHHDRDGNLVSAMLYKYDDNIHFFPEPGTWAWDWNLKDAYYINYYEEIYGTHLWTIADRPVLTFSNYSIVPDPAWDATEDTIFHNTAYTRGWYFISYPCAGYTKAATTYDDPNRPEGDQYSYMGPFHELIWNGATHIASNDQYLTIVKSDEGKFYIPYDPIYFPIAPEIDNLVFLEPGKGYILGFRQETSEINFPGWQNYALNDNIQNPFEPSGKGSQSQIASAGHFQFKKYTHWSYPVIIDTVDLQLTPMTTGDEIGVFDGDICVGSEEYSGEFPMVIACWKDDMATPDTIDGYLDDNPMIFIWYDASENQEITFVPPTTTSAVQDDNPIAPTHSGFGAGFYAVRSFMNGAASVIQLPTKFVLGQNYPNPFNNETVIPLELPERSKIKIDLYNIQGQLISTCYNGIENAGTARIKVNGANLASGVYFAKLTAEGLEKGAKFTDVSKVVLLK